MKEYEVEYEILFSWIGSARVEAESEGEAETIVQQEYSNRSLGHYGHSHKHKRPTDFEIIGAYACE